MRNNALTMCCGVCVAGAFGVFTRWMQNLTAFDEQGLYVQGSLWGWMLLLLCALPPVSLSDRRSCTLTALKIRLNN